MTLTVCVNKPLIHNIKRAFNSMSKYLILEQTIIKFIYFKEYLMLMSQRRKNKNVVSIQNMFFKWPSSDLSLLLEMCRPADLTQKCLRLHTSKSKNTKYILITLLLHSVFCLPTKGSFTLWVFYPELGDGNSHLKD